MGIDLSKNDYSEINGLSNVLWERSHTSTIDASMVYILDPYIGPGIKRMAMARPEWTLIGTRATSFGGQTDTRHVTRFDVWDGTERMGLIEREYRNGDYCYGITNSRIAAKLQRGSIRYTKDTNKALKLVYSTFSPKSHGEAMTEARNKVNNALSSSANNKRFTWGRIRDTHATEQVNTFLLERWDEFMETLVASGMDTKTLAECAKGPEIMEQWGLAKVAEAQFSAGTGTLLMLRGGKYVTYRKATSESVLVVDTLRPELKVSLGMLKLSPDDTFLPGVGYRQNATTYFLMDPEGGL